MSAREAMRRGWCPSTLRPMETGDGWLVRLHPPGARLTPRQLSQVAELAAAYGNGLVEISARANLQIRGVSAASHPELVKALLAADLVEEGGEGPQRLVLTSPLAGAKSLALAAEIERIGRALVGLPAKTGIVVDDGGSLPLDDFPADLRLLAMADGWLLGLADGRCFGILSPSQACDRIADLLGVLRDRHAADPCVRSLRDVPSAFLQEALADLVPVAGPSPRDLTRIVGCFPDATIVNLPFGRADSAVLSRFSQAARAAGAHEIRFSPFRGIACLGLSTPECDRLLAEARSLGLITDPDDPRLCVQACAGSPACARGEAPSMNDAATLAEATASLLREGIRVHVSGCAKSCAHPGPSDLTLVGRNGRYGVVIGGTTHDEAIAELDLCELLARLQPGQDIHSRLHAAGRPAGRRA